MADSSPARPIWMGGPPVQALLAALGAGGIEARFVGGCVRDWMAGRTVADIDLAVTAPPATVMRALEAAKIKVVPTGLKHGTVTAVAQGQPFELTTLRRDVETDGRRAVVAFTDDWREDAARRDFTFNALYAEADGTIHDYFDGRADLDAGRVRFIGDPDRRIEEDRLRVLRFFRFHAWFGTAPLDEAGFAACRRHAGALDKLSGERVAKELLRLLAASQPAPSLDAMAEAGVLAHWLPEYKGTAHLRELIHREDIPDPLRRLASILSTPAPAVARRLRLSTQQALRLEMMLDPETRVDTENPRVRIYRLGTTLFIDRLLLQPSGDWCAALALARSWTPPELPVSGGDALKLGLKPGPKVGALIEAVERWWIAGDFRADRAACLAELERLARTT
ncbi:MAG: CCA tRNA nucleotidyltransferase [Alphaproteobacteria bacterium]|nr:CCA tRNA nucleotidyltransferase [Alphaproteobacteria bacterium]